VRFKLAQDIEFKVADLKEKTAKTLFRQFVLEEAWGIEPNWDYPFVFKASQYPASTASRYRGRYEFRKHYFPILADLKDGGEEFLCAQLVDNHAQVKHWVRNLDRAPAGFWLTTSKGRFFPDFIAELNDGRVAVIEYKGAHLVNDPYEIEKRLIGELWAKTSKGRCIFGWITSQRNGLSVSEQLDATLS
jgi:type III restriction enzyme